MGNYIGSIGYYQGDKYSNLDLEVPQRPSHLHTWDGEKWNLTEQDKQLPTVEEQLAAVRKAIISNEKEDIIAIDEKIKNPPKVTAEIEIVIP